MELSFKEKIEQYAGKGSYSFLISLIGEANLIEEPSEHEDKICFSLDDNSNSFFRFSNERDLFEGYLNLNDDSYELEICFQTYDEMDIVGFGNGYVNQFVFFKEGQALCYDQIAVETAEKQSKNGEDLFTDLIGYLGDPCSIIPVENDINSKYTFLTNYVPKIMKTLPSREQVEVDSKIGRGAYDFIKKLLGDEPLKYSVDEDEKDPIYLTNVDDHFARIYKNGHMELFLPAGEFEMGYLPNEKGFIGSCFFGNEERRTAKYIVFEEGFAKVYDEKALISVAESMEKEGKLFSFFELDKEGLLPEKDIKIDDSHQSRLLILLETANNLKENYSQGTK